MVNYLWERPGGGEGEKAEILCYTLCGIESDREGKMHVIVRYPRSYCSIGLRDEVEEREHFDFMGRGDGMRWEA